MIRQGYNYITLVHQHGTTTSSTNLFKLFYDTDVGANPSVTIPTLNVVSTVIKYLSGVRYFDAGSIFSSNCNGSNCFNNVYHSSREPLVFSSSWGINSPVNYLHTSVTGIAGSVPAIGESMIINN